MMLRFQSQFALAIRSCLGISASLVGQVGERWGSRSRHRCRQMGVTRVVDHCTPRLPESDAPGEVEHEPLSVGRHFHRTIESR